MNWPRAPFPLISDGNDSPRNCVDCGDRRSDRSHVCDCAEISGCDGGGHVDSHGTSSYWNGGSGRHGGCCGISHSQGGGCFLSGSLGDVDSISLFSGHGIDCSESSRDGLGGSNLLVV